MKVRRLALVNYRRHRHLDLEFPDGVFAIVGANGSGKSSLLEAIGFALFGIQATRTPKALLRHSDAAPSDEVRVELDLELAGQAIHIMRGFRGASLTAHAQLEVDGRPLVASGANSHAAVTQEMERLLGMDRTAFFTSIVAQQKELAKLAELKAQERKQLILRLLGIDAIDRAIDEARDRRRKAQQRVDDLREAVPDLAALRDARAQAKATRMERASASAAADQAWQQTQEALAAATAAYETQAQAAAQREAVAQELTQQRTRHAALAASIEDLDARCRKAAEAQQAAAGVEADAQQRPEVARQLAEARRHHHQWAVHLQQQEEAERLRARLKEGNLERPEPVDPGRREQAAHRLRQAQERDAHRVAAANAAQAHLDRLADTQTDAPCPFCDRPLHDALPELRQRLQQEYRDHQAAREAHQADLEAAQHEVTKAQAAWDAYQQAAAQFQAQQEERQRIEERLATLAPSNLAPPPDLAPLEAALQQAEAAERTWIEAQALARDHERLANQLKDAQQERTVLERAMAERKEQLGKLPVLDMAKERATLEAARHAERQADGARRDAEHALDLANQQLMFATAQVEQGKLHKERFEAARADLRLWTALSGGRDRGLLEQFRRHMVGKIRPAINQEASRLLARFTDGRYRELILDEDYGVFLVEDGVPYALARFSGGESDLAHLALRLAIGRLLAQRSGAELRFLALDEVFGSLDRQRRDAVLAALHGLEGLYSQIVLVTHQEDLHEALDATLRVRREGATSQVAFHQG